MGLQTIAMREQVFEEIQKPVFDWRNRSIAKTTLKGRSINLNVLFFLQAGGNGGTLLWLT